MTDTILLERLGQVVDPRLGIVRWMVDAKLQSDEPPLFISLCEFTNPLKMPPQRITDDLWQAGSLQESQSNSDMRSGSLNPVGRRHATGAGLDYETAIWASLGEACERYAMHLDDGRFSVSAKLGELEGEVVSPDRFITFSDEQYDDVLFPFRRFNPVRPLLWRQALNLTRDRPAWVPAQFVSGPLGATEFQLLDSLYSTGCAAGSTPAHAVSSAMREAIERDAFMFYWMTRTTPRRLDATAAAPFLPEALRPMLDWNGVDTHILWLETDHGIPVVATLLLPRYGKGVAIGASCHPDWRQAVTKAVVEAFHTLNWLSDMDRWDVAVPDESQVRDFPDHVALYRADGRRAQLNFLLGGDPVVLTPPGDAVPEADDYRGLVRTMTHQLASIDLDTYVVNLTPPDLASIDMHVARVLVPGLHPIYAGYGFEHLDRRRVDAMCDRLGRPRPDALNRDPHPFP